jgi:formylglycine-generating enzyme required for sulfatase activity
VTHDSKHFSLITDAPLVGACGRADLLYALALAQGDAGCEHALAAVLGFFSKPEEQGQKRDISVETFPPTIIIEPSKTDANLNNVFSPYRLVSIEPLQSHEEWHAQQQGTQESGKLTHTDMDAWDTQRPVPKASSIVPWTRLWPRLRQAVACRHTAGIDFKRLTNDVARGIAVRQLPRLSRLAWPNPLTVVLDFSDRLTPYWDDWHWLCKNLHNSLHRQARFYRLSGVPQKPLQKIDNGKPDAKFRDWPELQAGSTLLLVSDLGMVDVARPWPRACWQNKLDDYKKQGVRVVVTAPVSTRHLHPTLVNAAHTLRLSPDSSLRPLARMHTVDSPVTDASPADYSGSQTLLAMLSVATKVELALLRDLRRCLPDDSHDAGMEGDVWCHQHLDTSALACAVSPYAVNEWRGAFQQLPEALQQRTLECLRNWHAQLPQAIHHEETLVWCYLTQNQGNDIEAKHLKAARAFFVRVTNSLKAKQLSTGNLAARDLQIQLAGRHLQWVSPILASQESYIGDLSIAVTEAYPIRSVLSLPEGINPIAWLKALPVQTAQKLTLVQQADLRLSLRADFTPETADLGLAPWADLVLDRLAILWSWDEQGKVPNYRPWYWQTAPLDNAPELSPLVAVSGETEQPQPALSIYNGRQQLRFEAIAKPAWASELGQDHYGLYADLELKGITQRFRWINPGTFLMGSPPDEPERLDGEQQHAVTLSQGYWLADTACTQALWMAVMGENPSRFKDNADQPVENVSWEDAQAFSQRLNQQFPELYARLPTEAEWEYACRAGTTTPFSFGDTITPKQVNYDGNYPYANGTKGKFRAKTVPVKSLPANPWGLYEMHGNVWEWCADWFGDYTKTVATDLTGPEEGSARVLRGGSWYDRAGHARSAYRSRLNPAIRIDDIGFRLALGRTGVSPEEQAERQTAPDRTAEVEPGGLAGRRLPDGKLKSEREP